MTKNPANGKATETPTPAPQQPMPSDDFMLKVDVDEMNGRLAELQDVNNFLVARCTELRGLLAKKTREIAQLNRALNDALNAAADRAVSGAMGQEAANPPPSKDA